MTRRDTGMSRAVELGLPLDPPEPVAHCPVCQDAAASRVTALAGRDLSAATDCAVVIRAHPHDGARPAL